MTGATGADLAARLETHWPRALWGRRSYVLWNAAERPGGGISKRPVRWFGRRLEPISAYDLRGHLTFPHALEQLRVSGATGVGLVLAPEDNLVAVDLDHVATDGVLNDFARGVVQELDGYAEWSPSRQGVHVWVRATLPGTAAVRHGSVEVLRKGLVTITGDPLPGTMDRVPGRQRALATLHARHVAPRPLPPPPTHLLAALPEADALVIARASRARNGARFLRLFSTTELDGNTPSQQDWRLALMVVYSTRGDLDQARRIMQRSARFRAKWNARIGATTYLDWTLHRAALASQRFVPVNRTPPA